MDSFATSWPLSRLAPPPAFEPFPSDGGGASMTHTTDPFGFGPDIALPAPAAAGATFGDPAHTLHHNLVGFGYDPFSAATMAAMYALSSDPFGLGLGFAAYPPVTGYNPYYGGATAHADVLAGYDAFDGGATVHANVQYCSNPFAVDRWDGLLPPPALFDPSSAGGHANTGLTYLHDYALPAVPPAPDSPRTPVYGNPGAALSMHVPAPWEWDLYNGHVQPAVDEPQAPETITLIPAPAAAPACDDATCKNSTAQLCAQEEDVEAHLYDDDIEAALRAQEEDVEARPSPDYLDTTQGGRMSPEMRTALISWMAEICQRFDNDLGASTLHRAVSYVDRFLSARPLGDVTTRGLCLLGAAAVFAAAKYEDQGAVRKLMGAREIARYAGLAGGEEVVAMERALLAALGYRLGGPTAHTFVEHFTRGYSHEEGGVEPELRFRARDFVNLSLLHYGCLELKPSAVAAAAMFLAALTLKPSYGLMKSWNKKLKELTGYKPKDLERGVEAIRSLIRRDDGNGNGFDIDIFPMFYEDPD